MYTLKLTFILLLSLILLGCTSKDVSVGDSCRSDKDCASLDDYGVSPPDVGRCIDDKCQITLPEHCTEETPCD